MFSDVHLLPYNCRDSTMHPSQRRFRQHSPTSSRSASTCRYTHISYNKEQDILRNTVIGKNSKKSDLIACSCVAQPGAFDLVGYIIYDVEGKPYQSVFYNGTIEVVESGGLLSGESVFLITLGIALLLLLGLWAYSQVQRLTKVNHRISFSFFPVNQG